MSRRMAKNDDVTDLCVSDFRYPVVSLNGFAECGLELVSMLFSTVSDSYRVSCTESKTKQMFQYVVKLQLLRNCLTCPIYLENLTNETLKFGIFNIQMHCSRFSSLFRNYTMICTEYTILLIAL